MTDKSNDGGFSINVYSPGNFIAREMTFTGTVNIGQGSPDSGGYSDEQIARAITAICGSDRPLNSKRRWAAVYWCLRWYCNFPSDVRAFCDRVKTLPLGPLDYECDYVCIRHEACMSFMDENPRHIDKVRPSKKDQGFFIQCREVVLALVSELGRAALPQARLGGE